MHHGAEDERRLRRYFIRMGRRIYLQQPTCSTNINLSTSRAVASGSDLGSTLFSLVHAHTVHHAGQRDSWIWFEWCWVAVDCGVLMLMFVKASHPLP
jgi:hypothetical protein